VSSRSLPGQLHILCHCRLVLLQGRQPHNMAIHRPLSLGTRTTPHHGPAHPP
jgi:hypothetical protein